MLLVSVEAPGRSIGRTRELTGVGTRFASRLAVVEREPRGCPRLILVIDVSGWESPILAECCIQFENWV